jgi:hypothetical protein
LARQQFNPDAATVRSNFDATINRFKGTQLCKRLEVLVHDLFLRTNCNKIVAFGGFTICAPSGPETAMAIRLQTQHAALLVIGDVWKEINNARIPIYIQDPQYSELDERVAAHYGMQVVNGDVGHQMGWLKIDESTLVIDLRTCFPLIQLVFEITRPAAIFSPVVLTPDLFDPAEPFSYTLRHNGQEVVVPGLGV